MLYDKLKSELLIINWFSIHDYAQIDKNHHYRSDQAIWNLLIVFEVSKQVCASFVLSVSCLYT